MMEDTENKTEKELELIKENQIKTQNKQLKNILLIGGIVVICFLFGFFIFYSMNNFKYKGMDFVKGQEGKITFYRTSFPLFSMTGNYVADYNIYLRNNPRDLKDVSVTGKVNLLPDVVINANAIEEIKCEDRIIAVANMRDIFSSAVLDKHFFRNETLKCDSEGRYTYIEIVNSDKNSIVQFGPSCYFLNVKDCDVLKTTEKFILEALAEKTGY
jgi:hypothetical protein